MFRNIEKYELSESPSFSTPIPWVGAGRPAFLGDAGGSGPEGKPVRIDSWQEFLQAFSGRGGEAFRRSMERYFAGGGRSCYVVNFAQLGSLPDGRAAQIFLGEDGGPGFRTGLQSLSDLEGIGTIAAPGILNPLIHEGLVETIRRRPSRSLVLEGPFGAPPPSSLLDKLGAAGAPAERVAWLPPAESDRLDGVPPSGPALGGLERGDFDPGRPEAQLLKLPHYGDVPTLGGRFASLREWRRWEGLRRSLDFGTRWVVLEVQDDLLRRRVEREVRAFLQRLHEAGFFGGGRAEEAFSVQCPVSREPISRELASRERPENGAVNGAVSGAESGPASSPDSGPESARGGEGSRLTIAVRVRLRGFTAEIHKRD
ncbi:MAG: hypothetical protein HY717_16635 [Planctomycetes bacterium]|nr:hypothetical protein [Planctomycetota bacterium]